MSEHGRMMLELINEQEKNGRVVLYILDDVYSFDLDSFIKQPVDGMLWDLNRDKVTCAAWIEEERVGWVNNYACALVIRKLKEEIERLNGSQTQEDRE